MLKMIYEYKKALRDAKKMYEPYKNMDPKMITAQQSSEQKIISSMIKDLEYVIKWLETGRDPSSRRGVDMKGVYAMDPQLLDKLKFDKTEIEIDWKELPIYKKSMIEDALSELTEREREAFFMIRVEMMTYEQTAQLMNIKKTSVQNHLQRAEKKIGKRKKESLFIAG